MLRKDDRTHNYINRGVHTHGYGLNIVTRIEVYIDSQPFCLVWKCVVLLLRLFLGWY